MYWCMYIYTSMYISVFLSVLETTDTSVRVINVI